jgi:protein SERAC1
MAEWATIGGHLVNLVKRTNTDIVEVLKIHSEVLAIVQQTFHTMIKSREDDGKQKLQITCFAEEKPVQRLGLTAVVCRRNSIDSALYSLRC